MKTLAFIVLFYGVLILVGGWMGHYKAGSSASLVSGLVFGIFLLGCSLFLFKNQRPAAYVALILTFVLDAFFTYRFSQTLKFMPSGMMSLMSLLTLILIASQMRQLRR